MITHKGEVIKLRDIVRHLDAVLSKCEGGLGDELVVAQYTQELMQDVFKARLCAKHMLSDYGDNTA